MAHPVQNLSGFMNAVRNVRAKWDVAEHVDLWFRGEGQKHETSILRPALYRPPRGENAAMKEVGELLNIESRLYEEFIRVGNQLLTEKPVEDEDWDWYFLTRHHDAPTRLLDWSDGALVALPFAL
jgi:FRG domain